MNKGQKKNIMTSQTLCFTLEIVSPLEEVHVRLEEIPSEASKEFMTIQMTAQCPGEHKPDLYVPAASSPTCVSLYSNANSSSL